MLGIYSFVPFFFFLTRYPRGKSCRFTMTTAGLIGHLKATSTPVWIYTMQHTGSAQVKVMSRGFLNDPNLLERLIKLSTEERSVDPNPGILLYKKTVVVPTFVDSRSPNGTVTMKIKVTASPKQGHFFE